MNKEEAKNLAIQCAKLWPNQVTKELSAWAIDQFLPHDFMHARKAIEQYRGEPNGDGFLNWGRLLDAIRLSEKSADLRSTQSKVMSYADMQRQISPCFVSMNDPQVILCTQRHLWRMALQRNPQAFAKDKTGAVIQQANSLAAHRSHIENECLMLLIGAGMDHEQAPQWVSPVFDDDVNYFRQVIESLDGWKAPEKPAEEAAAAAA